MKQLYEYVLPQRRLKAVVLVVLTLIGVLVPGELLWAARFDVGCDADALIAAIIAANANGGANVINLAPGCTYTLIVVNNTTDCPNGLPSITSPIVINGNGATIERSPAATKFRIFHVDTPGALTLRNLTITGGVQSCSEFAFNVGGAIVNFGTLTLEGCTVSDNSAGIGGAIANAGDATLVNCTVSTNTAGSGGGIDNLGTLQLTNCTVSDNDASDGGGIYNDFGGTATLVNSSISGNSGPLWGGGITNAGTIEIRNTTISGNSSEFGAGINNKGELTLDNSTVSDNPASDQGGGIYNLGSAQLTNCTISGNSATNEAGGLYNDGEVMLNNVTMAGNTAGSDGGGIYCHPSNTVNVKNTLIADNTVTTTGPDCSGNLESYGYNLIKDQTGCTINEAENPGTNITGQDPLLGPLANNGGPTFTHTLLPGSPAINAGSCTDISGNLISADQRGYPRPAPLGGNCDIGAYEAEQAYARGDVNGDGVINLLDARLCAQIAQGYITGTPQQRAAADVDSDGDVDETDARILAEFIIGIRTTLP